MYGECLLCPLYPLLLEHNIWSNFSTRRKYCRYRVNVALLVILVSFFIQRLRKGFNIVISEQQIHAQQRKYAWYPGTGELAMLIHFRFSQWVSWTTYFSWLPFLVLKFTPLCKTVLQFGNSFFFFSHVMIASKLILIPCIPKTTWGAVFACRSNDFPRKAKALTIVSFFFSWIRIVQQESIYWHHTQKSAR